MKFDNPTIAASLLVALGGLSIFPVFLPPTFETAALDGPSAAVGIRKGEVMATGALAILAATAAILTRSAVPLAVGAVIAGAMTAIYEWALWSDG